VRRETSWSLNLLTYIPLHTLRSLKTHHFYFTSLLPPQPLYKVKTVLFRHALAGKQLYHTATQRTMMTSVADFDRSNPLFERNVVSFEVVTTPTSTNNNNAASSTNNANENKRNGNFTVRILEGRRSETNSSGGERVIRFEMSNECNLVDDFSSSTHHQQQCTPSRSRTPIIHAPFMTVDRGGQSRHSTMMQGGPPPYHQSPHTRSSHPKQKSLNLPIELYELEVGESDFAALRRDQALLVDFNSFSDSLISLLQCCELGSDEGGYSSTHQQTFQETSNQYGQQQPYDESSGGGWNGNGQGGGISRQSMTGQQQHQWGSSNNSNTWRTPSYQQGGLNYHGQRMMSSPFAKMNCSTSMPVSTYACRLEVDASSNDSMQQQWRQNSTQQSNTLHARFSIVESNQFRELTHLALNLNVGTDKSVRCYLSSRYVCCYVEVYLLFIYDSASYTLPPLHPTSTDSVRPCSRIEVLRPCMPSNNNVLILPRRISFV